MKKNQIGWVVGFVDGEGCFCISFSLRKKMRLGIEVRPSFSVSQKAPSLSSLKQLQELFQCGGIRYSRRDHTYKFEVRNRQDLQNKIIPFFQRETFQTEKKKDFDSFVWILALMKRNHHLTKEGMFQILEKAYQMNPSGIRKYTLSQLLEVISQSKKDS